jgi:hypothetical protein
MSAPWYTDQRMLAAGNARRRPAGEDDLPQPGAAKAMPAAPSGPFTPSAGTDVARIDTSTLADRLATEAERVGLSPEDLARLYVHAHSRPLRITRTWSLRRMFSRKAH